MTLRIPRLTRTLPVLTTLLLAGFASGCTTTVVQQPSADGPASGLAAIAPQLSVERFLQAVNAQDFASMAALFGTVDGPYEREWTELELQMSTVAQILNHSDYRIVSERLQPGRAAPTRRVGVTLTISGNVYPDVAFLVVQTPDGRWFVNEIDLEAVTRN